MRKIVLNDTNIIIDLMSVNLFDSLFRLPWEVHITDMVKEELTREGQLTLAEEAIERGCLLVDKFSGEEVGEIHEWHERIQGITNLSICDCSVWYASEKRGYIVLTGDKKLRNVVEESGVEVHGVLYVLQTMVDELLISPSEAISILRQLQAFNQRLPKNDIDTYVNKWKCLIEL